MFDLPTGVVEGTDVICGYLTVPEQHNQPDGPTIQLAVAIIKSQDPNPKSDPLFVAQGGPGGSTIETYATPLAFEQYHYVPTGTSCCSTRRGT